MTAKKEKKEMEAFKFKNISDISFGELSTIDLASLVKNISRKKQKINTVHIIYDDNLEVIKETVRNRLLGYSIQEWPIDCSNEPTTQGVDLLTSKLQLSPIDNSCLIGIGGGSALDTCKAVSNLLTNDVNAAELQGWDRVGKKGLPKIGIPTLFGTGAEATRTCVLKNSQTGAKLGMNSDFTYFDALALDPCLSLTVSFDQFFYTAMDTYIHCIESLAGKYRNPLGDQYSKLALNLIKEVFEASDPREPDILEKLTMASYFGGTAIGFSKVGLIHPFSAGLSMTFNMPHCLANCIAFTGLSDYYPNEYEVFTSYLKNFDISLKTNNFFVEGNEDLLFKSTVCHNIPLENALGETWKQLLTKNEVISRFKSMENAVKG